MMILVTGGAGYIGSITVAELLGAGYDVLVYDNLSKGYSGAVSPDAELIIGDIADRDKLIATLKSRHIEAVLHFAALIEAGESMSVPERYFRNNTAGTLTLLEAMLAAGVPRLVFSSTAAVYGQPENTPILESATLRPTNAYGESKLLVEQMLSWFHQVHGLRYASLRYFNAAGATANLGEAHHPESHLIPLVLAVAQGTRPNISVYGSDYPTPDGTCIRDYIHVVDLARAHILALAALDRRPKMIYNLGNGQGFSVRQVIETARRITGTDIPIKEAPRRPGDPAILVASSQKIRQELGWIPKYPELDSVIISAWQWHQKHPRGYEVSHPHQSTVR
jgi:UDP-glucose 4-epimerase